MKEVFPDVPFDESYGTTECGGITMNGQIISDV